MRRERGGQSRVRVGVHLRAALLRTKDGVSQSLRGFVGKLSRSERLEPNLALIYRALGGLACPVELFLELVE
jgi:hypothetical protein